MNFPTKQILLTFWWSRNFYERPSLIGLLLQYLPKLFSTSSTKLAWGACTRRCSNLHNAYYLARKRSSVSSFQRRFCADRSGECLSNLELLIIYLNKHFCERNSPVLCMQSTRSVRKAVLKNYDEKVSCRTQSSCHCVNYQVFLFFFIFFFIF